MKKLTTLDSKRNLMAFCLLTLLAGIATDSAAENWQARQFGNSCIISHCGNYVLSCSGTTVCICDEVDGVWTACCTTGSCDPCTNPCDPAQVDPCL